MYWSLKFQMLSLLLILDFSAISHLLLTCLLQESCNNVSVGKPVFFHLLSSTVVLPSHALALPGPVSFALPSFHCLSSPSNVRSSLLIWLQFHASSLPWLPLLFASSYKPWWHPNLRPLCACSPVAGGEAHCLFRSWPLTSSRFSGPSNYTAFPWSIIFSFFWLIVSYFLLYLVFQIMAWYVFTEKIEVVRELPYVPSSWYLYVLCHLSLLQRNSLLPSKPKSCSRHWMACFHPLKCPAHARLPLSLLQLSPASVQSFLSMYQMLS